MKTKIWYAITDLQNEDNDWGYGEISVIADNEDPECKNIITLEDITD